MVETKKLSMGRVRSFCEQYTVGAREGEVSEGAQLHYISRAPSKRVQIRTYSGHFSPVGCHCHCKLLF